MENRNNDKSAESDFPVHGEAELYGDPKIASFDAKIPKFLILTYIVLPIWGIILGVSVIAFLDWLGRRKDRQSKPHPRV